MISRKNVTYITNYLCCTETSVPADNILSDTETDQLDTPAVDNSLPPVEGKYCLCWVSSNLFKLANELEWQLIILVSDNCYLILILIYGHYYKFYICLSMW